MGNVKNNDTFCKSVFKNGEKTITKAQFTKAWVDMINKIERNKYI